MNVRCPSCGNPFWHDPQHGEVAACAACGKRFEAAAAMDATVLVKPAKSLAEDSYVPFAAATGSVVPPGEAPTMMGGGTVDDGPEAPTLIKGQPETEQPTLMAPPSGEARTVVTARPTEAPTVVNRAEEAPTMMVGGAAAPAPPVGQAGRAATPAPPRPPSGSKASIPGGGAHGENLIGRRLGGFFVDKLLGAGGMGAVYLAKQVSLDRDVALKVLPARFAADPDFLSRFIREALAAAHMSHHNVVQVYDAGNDGRTYYIAMEFVKGTDLGAMIRKDGKLSVEDASGYVLQAARGLHYAHQNNFIHRDIKPDNLMVNEHGIVKIADMGLAKKIGEWERAVGTDVTSEQEMIHMLADANMTATNVAMGTPAYMAPEQGRDASRVDHRADQYSLGCTLYYLCAGKTPFTGKTTFEIISKHASEPVIPLEQFVKNVPKELSYIIEKMLAKDPKDRYPSMGEVVEALESYLGVEAAKGPYTPREHHVAVLEREIGDYYKAKGLPLIATGRIAFPAFCAVVFLLALIGAQPFIAAAALGLLILTPIASIVYEGLFHRGPVFARLKNTLLGMTLKGWLATVLTTIMVALGLFVSGLLMPWLMVSVLAAGIGVAWQMFVLNPVRKARVAPIANTQEMFKQLRIRGVSEDAIQDFVCRFSGEQWEEFFEELFGYDDMLLMRARVATREKVKPRKRHATWRDPIVRWLDEIDNARRREKEQKQIAAAEKNRLAAEGMSAEKAEEESNRLADAAVEDMGKTVRLTAELREQIAQASKEHVRKHQRTGLIGWVYRLARLAVALATVGGPASLIAKGQGVAVPEMVSRIYTAFYPLAIQPGILSIAVMIVGLMLVFLSFSSQRVAPFLGLIGGLGMVFAPQLAILGAQPATLVANVCMATVVLAFVLQGWGWLTSRR